MRKGLNKLIAVLLTAGAILVGATPRVQANLVAWGDPALGHSWDQLWVINSGIDPFNTLVATIISPGSANFQSAALLGFTPVDWTITVDQGTTATATGSATTMLEFTTHFMGNPFLDYTINDPLRLRLTIGDGDIVQQTYDMVWNGNAWSPAGQNNGPPSVPDGGMTLLLLGVSALGLAAFRKKLV